MPKEQPKQKKFSVISSKNLNIFALVFDAWVWYTEEKGDDTMNPEFKTERAARLYTIGKGIFIAGIVLYVPVLLALSFLPQNGWWQLTWWEMFLALLLISAPFAVSWCVGFCFARYMICLKTNGSTWTAFEKLRAVLYGIMTVSAALMLVQILISALGILSGVLSTIGGVVFFLAALLCGLSILALCTLHLIRKKRAYAYFS